MDERGRDRETSSHISTVGAAGLACRSMALNGSVRRILDSVHAGLITGAIYWYCITSFTNLLAIQQPIWCVRMDESLLSRTQHAS